VTNLREAAWEPAWLLEMEEVGDHATFGYGSVNRAAPGSLGRRWRKTQFHRAVWLRALIRGGPCRPRRDRLPRFPDVGEPLRTRESPAGQDGQAPAATASGTNPAADSHGNSTAAGCATDD
jgi:hypothetical protein